MLVTALHCLTGREPNGKPKSAATLGIPNLVKFHGHIKGELRLYDQDNDADTCNPMYWRLHGGPAFDVALLPLDGIPRVHESFLLHDSLWNPETYNRHLKLSILQDCYIIGFPEGLVHSVGDRIKLPIWKTGHIASEPYIRFEGHPKLLIDATTRPGMSGAPVFVFQERLTRLVGIYTGRTSETSDLGWVWWPPIITELLRTGPRARDP